MHKHDEWRWSADFEGMVRLVLIVDWDPIGVFGYADAIDQYDRYAGPISQLVRDGASVETVAEHLDEIERLTMGLRGGRPEVASVARKLQMLYSAVVQDTGADHGAKP